MRLKLTFALALLLIASCAKRQVILMPLEPIVGPVTVEALKAGRFLGGVEGLRSEVSMSAFRNGTKMGSLGGALAYMRPDSLRLRGYDPFGYVVVDIVMDGGNIQVYVPGANALYYGSLGLLDAPETSYRMEETKDGYVLYASGEDGGVSRVYRYDADLRNRFVAISGERVSAEMEFGEFSGRLPLSISIALSNGFSLHMKLKETEVDAPLSEELFLPLNPSGVRILPLEGVIDSFLSRY